MTTTLKTLVSSEICHHIKHCFISLTNEERRKIIAVYTAFLDNTPMDQQNIVVDATRQCIQSEPMNRKFAFCSPQIIVLLTYQTMLHERHTVEQVFDRVLKATNPEILKYLKYVPAQIVLE